MGMPALENGSSFDGETADIFSRISQALPDLHASLARQKEVQAQLSQKLRAKDEEIYDLKERIIIIENKHSAEAKEQVKELREQIAETHKHKREAEDTKLAWEASTKSWESKVKELEAMYSAERARAKKEFDEWKAAASTRHDAEKIALAIQYDKKLKEADLAAEARRQEEADALAAEKE
jgi:chromosome segregation ATPase